MLADKFFQLAHHHATGEPREGMTPRVLSMGLGAALFGELISDYVVEVQPLPDSDDDTIVLISDRIPADPIQVGIVHDLRREHLLPVRDWLTYLAVTAHARVAERLRRTGHVYNPRRAGPPWARRTVFVPIDMNKAAGPEASIHVKLMDVASSYPVGWQLPHPPIRRHFTYDDTCLAGLALATGLDRMLLDGTPPNAREYFIWAVSELYDPMRRLVAHTQAAVGDLVLAHRT